MTYSVTHFASRNPINWCTHIQNIPKKLLFVFNRNCVSIFCHFRDIAGSSKVAYFNLLRLRSLAQHCAVKTAWNGSSDPEHGLFVVLDIGWLLHYIYYIFGYPRLSIWGDWKCGNSNRKMRHNENAKDGIILQNCRGKKCIKSDVLVWRALYL